MGVRDQVPRLGKRARAPGSHRAHGTQHGDLSETARRAVTRGSVRLGDAGRRLDGAATRRASTKCRWGRGPKWWTGRVGFSHVEDLLTAVTPDCLLHLSALTRPRAQDEGSKGAPLRLFADRQHRIVDPRRSGHLDVAAQHVMHDSTAPNTSPRNSEAPLAIFGCAVKPGSEAMKTMTLTTRMMAESAPTWRPGRSACTAGRRRAPPPRTRPRRACRASSADRPSWGAGNGAVTSPKFTADRQRVARRYW